MFILYDLIFLIFALAYLPVFLWRRKLHPCFEQRLGVLPEGLTLGRPFWVHAVSVGEAVSVRHLVGDLRLSFPGKKFVISTVTPTGNKIASSIAAKGDFVTYLPVDFSPVVAKTVAAFDPCALIIVETEIWPNLIYAAAKKGIPIFVVNGRISDRSFGRYRLVRFLLAPLLNRVAMFCVQSERDAQRLIALGLLPRKVTVTGNMKFDIQVADYGELRKDYRDYRLDMGIGSKEKLLVAASTHPGEEEIVIKSFLSLRQRFPWLRLLIAPRHPERSAEVAALAAAAGLEPARISTMAAGRAVPGADTAGKLFILDAVGKLMYFYAIADIVFVGGSLSRTGGHNILEPASLGKPVLFGPHMFNFREITALFLEHKAATMVADGDELTSAVGRLLSELSVSAEAGARARAIISGHTGATHRNKEIIKKLLPAGSVC